MLQPAVQLMTLDQVKDAVSIAVRNELGLIVRESQYVSAVLTEKEAAKYLNHSQDTLRRWRGESRGPAYIKELRSIRYLKKDLDTWINTSRTITAEA